MITKLKRVAGDAFVLCTFPLMFRGSAFVLSSGNSAEEVCKDIPEYLQSEGDETICFCRVGHWVFSESDGEMTPRDLTTVFQITPYETEALDDDTEDEEVL